MSEYRHCPLCGEAIDVSNRGEREEPMMKHWKYAHPTGR